MWLALFGAWAAIGACLPQSWVWPYIRTSAQIAFLLAALKIETLL